VVVYYLHGDHLGSTSLTTDSAGQKYAESRYYPYGQERWTSGALPMDFGFTGERKDSGFGLYDYNARYYSPYLNRFISPDSIVPGAGNPQAFNRYSYVNNNPLRYTDPSGHQGASWEDEFADAHAGRAPTDQDRWDYEFSQQVSDFAGWEATHKQRQLLYSAGITLDSGGWTTAEVGRVYDAVEGLSNVMGGTNSFRTKLGGVSIGRQVMQYGGLGEANRVWLNRDSTQWGQWGVVHELAHAGDAVNNWKLSEGLEKFTGGHTDPGAMREFLRVGLSDTTLPGCNKAGYFYGDIPPKGSGLSTGLRKCVPGFLVPKLSLGTRKPASLPGTNLRNVVLSFNRREDFAESVAAYIYPRLAEEKVRDRYLGNTYLYYSSYNTTLRWQYVNTLIK